LDRGTLPQDLSDVAVEQDAIGWRNFIDGFVSKGWSVAVQARFVAGGRRQTGHRWVVGLLRQLWKLSRDIWQYRNELAHGGVDSLSRHALDELNREILDQFRRGREDMPARLTGHFFRGSVHRLLAKPEPAKQAWLYGVVVARERHLRREYGDSAPTLAASRKVMRNWIQRRPVWRSRLRSPLRPRRQNANGPDQREPD